MLGESCSLELSEMVLAKHRHPVETEQAMASASSKDASSSGVLKVSEDRIKTILKSLQLLGLKRSNPQTPVQVDNG